MIVYRPFLSLVSFPASFCPCLCLRLHQPSSLTFGHHARVLHCVSTLPLILAGSALCACPQVSWAPPVYTRSPTKEFELFQSTKLAELGSAVGKFSGRNTTIPSVQPCTVYRFSVRVSGNSCVLAAFMDRSAQYRARHCRTLILAYSLNSPASTGNIHSRRWRAELSCHYIDALRHDCQAKDASAYRLFFQRVCRCGLGRAGV